jgi:predicted nucleic acid-binding protein
VLVATALIAGNKVLFSDDMQHAQLIDDQLRIVNPFDRS